MKTFLTKLFKRINMSTINNNDVSSTRIQSYIILIPILIMCLIFLIIELWQFIDSINTDKIYSISTEIIVIFGMLLSHHLAILFSRKNSQSINDISGKKKNEIE